MKRRLILVVVLWVVYSIVSTRPSPPIDCYQKATWDGRHWQYQDVWICVKEE